MDPDMINCMILRIHKDKKKENIPSRAIQRRTSAGARDGSKKKQVLDKDLASRVVDFAQWIAFLLLTKWPWVQLSVFSSFFSEFLDVTIIY